MDVEGIDVGNPVPDVGDSGRSTSMASSPRFAAAMSRAWNRWISDFCRRARATQGSAVIPLHDIDLAVAEARFAVHDLDAITLVLPSHLINNRTIYDRYYDPLWAAAQEMDVAVSFHGNHAVYAEHLAKRYLDNLVLSHACGQPVEMMLTLGAVLTGGVLSRFPRLRMAFLEGNCSWLPWWLWALDERWEAWGDHELFGQDALPSELFRRQCFVSVEPEEALAKHVVTEVGDDNLVMSTDWPHDDSRYPPRHRRIPRAAVSVEGDQAQDSLDNCARLLQALERNERPLRAMGERPVRRQRTPPRGRAAGHGPRAIRRRRDVAGYAPRRGSAQPPRPRSPREDRRRRSASAARSRERRRADRRREFWVACLAGAAFEPRRSRVP